MVNFHLILCRMIEFLAKNWHWSDCARTMSVCKRHMNIDVHPTTTIATKNVKCEANIFCLHARHYVFV